MYLSLHCNKNANFTSYGNALIILQFLWVRNWAWTGWTSCFIVFHKDWIMICSLIWRVDWGKIHIHFQSVVLSRLWVPGRCQPEVFVFSLVFSQWLPSAPCQVGLSSMTACFITVCKQRSYRESTRSTKSQPLTYSWKWHCISVSCCWLEGSYSWRRDYTGHEY